VPLSSAGLLVYRMTADGVPEVLLVHPGGPFWKNKDAGVWSIPKGEIDDDDDPEATADREFAEELGTTAPSGARIDLGQVTQRGGKRVRAWAVAGDLDVTAVRSNTFEIEWPRGSGQVRSFPEIDEAAWFTMAGARAKLVEAQGAFLDRLALALEGDDEPVRPRPTRP
jgi:predicted NUDIX family NTP pyrophosphohydrolase